MEQLKQGIGLQSLGQRDPVVEYKFAGYPTGYHTKEVIEQLGMDYAELKAKGVFD